MFTAGVDYIGSPSVVSIPASPGASQTCFEIDISDDDIAENDEEFLVNFQLQAGSDAQIGIIGSTCIRIIDNDGKLLVKIYTQCPVSKCISSYRLTQEL